MDSSVDLGSPERQAESRGGTIIAISVVFVALSSITVLLRLYTRKRILRIFGPEDVAIIIAQILSLGVSITTVLLVTIGLLGRHTEFASQEQLLAGAKGVYSNLLVYSAAQLMTKISFLLQYYRLFQNVIIQRLCKLGLAFLAVWGIVQQFLTAFSCSPLEVILPQWQGRCISATVMFQLNNIMNIVTDFAIFLIPVWPVLQLRIPLKRKIYLLVVFCLGFFACIVSIIRLRELYRMNDEPDVLWNGTAAAYWTVIELNVGILCACLPTLRPLYEKLSARLQSQSGHSGSSGPVYNRYTIGGSPQHGTMNTEPGEYIKLEVRSPGTVTTLEEVQHSSRTGVK